MGKKAEKKGSGAKRKVRDEDAGSGDDEVHEKADETAVEEEEQKDAEGAYDELPGGEEDEVREEYTDGMQKHHPATWVHSKQGCIPVYRDLKGNELCRKVMPASVLHASA